MPLRLTKELVLILPPLTPAAGRFVFCFLYLSAGVISAFGKRVKKKNP